VPLVRPRPPVASLHASAEIREGRDGLGKEMNLTCGHALSVIQFVFPAEIIFFLVSQTGPGFNLDRGTNNRDLKFRVYFAESL
jgi:hypothetical protein